MIVCGVVWSWIVMRVRYIKLIRIVEGDCYGYVI